LPHDGETPGPLALMLLTVARVAARVSASGELVRLDEQNRGTWDSALIAEGLALVGEGLAVVARGDAPWPVRDPRRDQCCPYLRTRRSRYRLVAGRGAL
jgi:RNA polymerase sigma-70 factor (ECF subfamily)